MREVLLSSNTILKEPMPSVNIVALDSNAVDAELSFRVSNIGEFPRQRMKSMTLYFDIQRPLAFNCRLQPVRRPSPSMLLKTTC